MPKQLEDKLRKEYGDNDHAVFGTLTNIEKSQGKDMHGQPLKGKGKVKQKVMSKQGRMGKRGKL